MMPALLAIQAAIGTVPRWLWLALGTVPRWLWLALGAGLLALWLVHHGADTQRAADAVAGAKAVTHELEVRRDEDRAAAADPDPAERLRRDWHR